MLDINTTPLIDVMLVLIIMLIITIPVQLHQLSLAGSGRQQAQAVIDVTPPVHVELRADGSVNWEGRRLADRVALELELAQLAAMAEPPQLLLRPDPKVAYRHVAALLASAQATGVTKIGLAGPERLAR